MKSFKKLQNFKLFENSSAGRSKKIEPIVFFVILIERKLGLVFLS